jgi:hypothetical protein
MAVVGGGGCYWRAWISVSAAHACVTIFGISGVHAGGREGALESQPMIEIGGAMKT